MRGKKGGPPNELPTAGSQYTRKTNKCAPSTVTIDRVYYDEHRRDHRIEYHEHRTGRRESSWYSNFRPRSHFEPLPPPAAPLPAPAAPPSAPSMACEPAPARAEDEALAAVRDLNAGLRELNANVRELTASVRALAELWQPAPAAGQSTATAR